MRRDATARRAWSRNSPTASGTVGGMIGGQVDDLEGEGKPPTRAAARIHSSREDRRAAARQRPHGRDLRRRGRRAATTRSPASANTSAWRFRSSTTFSTSSNLPRRSAKPPARTRSRRRSRFPRSTASTIAAHGGTGACERAHVALRPFGDARATAARTGRSASSSASHEDTRLMKPARSLLVERGLAESREKAQALIMAGEVLVNGQKAAKPGQSVDERRRARSAGAPALREPRRLQAGRARWIISPSTSTGRICLDVGASTGGFTDCLLQRGAARVHAIDVGEGSSIGNCATIRAWWCMKASTRAICASSRFGEPVGADRVRRQLHLRHA